MHSLERMRVSPSKKNYFKGFKISKQRTTVRSAEVPSEAVTGMENSKAVKSSISIFTLMDYAFDIKNKNILFSPRSRRFSFCFFFFKSFMVLCFTFKPITHFELIFA